MDSKIFTDIPTKLLSKKEHHLGGDIYMNKKEKRNMSQKTRRWPPKIKEQHNLFITGMIFYVPRSKWSGAIKCWVDNCTNYRGTWGSCTRRMGFIWVSTLFLQSFCYVQELLQKKHIAIFLRKQNRNTQRAYRKLRGSTAFQQ